MIQMVPQWHIVSIDVEVDDAEIRIDICKLNQKFEEVGTNNKQTHKSQYSCPIKGIGQSLMKIK